MGDRKPFKGKKDWPIPEIDLAAFPIARPLPKKDMEQDARRWTVCQILREIYHTVEDPLIRYKLRVASNMTKTMVEKICEYEPTWGKFRWPWREKPDAGE